MFDVSDQSYNEDVYYDSYVFDSSEQGSNEDVNYDSREDYGHYTV